LLAATAAGFAIAFREEAVKSYEMPQIYGGSVVEPAWRVVARWLLVGLLLAIPAAVRPFHLALFPAALALLPERRRGAGSLGLLLGALLMVGGVWAVHQRSGSSLMGYGQERQGFYSYTGYPDVDFPASEWSRSVERWGNTSWVHEGSLDFRFDASLLRWNAVYFFVGQHLGILPYFLPLLLAVAGWSDGKGWSRWLLLAGVGAVAACFFLVRPFNFWGGSGAVANRYFLPCYAALWFLPTTRARVSWAIATVLAALPFLYPMWLQPLRYPLGEDGGYRHVSAIARRFLPYETTQSHLKPSGQEDVEHDGLWIKLLSPEVRVVEEGKSFRLRGGSRGALLLGTAVRLESVWLDVPGPLDGDVAIDGGERGQSVLKPDGGIALEVRFERVRARHPMWWTWEPFYLQRLSIAVPGPSSQWRSFALSRQMPIAKPSRG
jgi:hypothetical protein